MSQPATAFDHILLTPEQMQRAEKIAQEDGITAFELMEEAGRAVADVTIDAIGGVHQCDGGILVLVGPGKNGGDGLVAARLLRDTGYRVRVVLLGEPEMLPEPARQMAALWGHDFSPLVPQFFETSDVIIDALFGTGLARPLDGDAASLINFANNSKAFKIAVDLPSGLDALTGRPLGLCFQADFTISFFARKPAHILAPGRFYCGGVDKVVLSDIGMDSHIFKEISLDSFYNLPSLWAMELRHSGPGDHKYDHGHVLVLGGREPTLGASRLAALAALRVGAGLVTLGAPGETYIPQATALTDVMVRRFDQDFGFLGMLTDVRINVVLMGPGAGQGEKTARLVQGVLEEGRLAVLDADALTSMVGRLDWLTKSTSGPHILTPHAGEFARLFPDIDIENDRVAAARLAAKRCASIVVLKGVSTVIASPDGRAAISGNAPSSLAVAGTGDILAGLIAGYAAQGMPPFEAACAGVWVHGEAGNAVGRGLIASDLLQVLPKILP